MEANKSHGGQLLDLTDLDRYLQSLLSVDLAETIRYAHLAKETILGTEKESWRESVNSNNINNNNNNNSESVWEDLLAVFTILASHGDTPGAKSLGFGLVSQQRYSFWRWIARATRNNNNDLFRYKILLYAFLRIGLPRLYQLIKERGLDYVNENPSQEPQHSDIQKLAIQRRKLVVKSLLGWTDGIVLPSLRLALLLSCWNRTYAGHGGNLSLWMSGLSYQKKHIAGTAIPLFVLYAHRRWFHREAVELLWNKIGRSLLAVQQETTEMSSALRTSLATECRMLRVRWSYKLDKFFRIQNETKPVACALCGTHPIAVPYRLVECCGKVACYVCLWDRLASTKKLFCPICHNSISRCEPVCWRSEQCGVTSSAVE